MNLNLWRPISVQASFTSSKNLQLRHSKTVNSSNFDPLMQMALIRHLEKNLKYETVYCWQLGMFQSAEMPHYLLFSNALGT
jgi:hypothetical protein